MQPFQSKLIPLFPTCIPLTLPSNYILLNLKLEKIITNCLETLMLTKTVPKPLILTKTVSKSLYSLKITDFLEILILTKNSHTVPKSLY